MKLIIPIPFLLLILAAVFYVNGIKYENTWHSKYDGYWTQADRSSTVEAKSEYVGKFVDALEEGNSKGEFASYNALWKQTPQNSFKLNLEALKSLKERLDDIKEMDPKSFEYNTAIQQITQQEQGEAGPMLEVFQGCWEQFGKIIFTPLLLIGIVGSIAITGVWVGIKL